MNSEGETKEEGLDAREIRLSDAAEARLEELMCRYPERKSAVMPALYLAQEEIGWINQDAVRWVSQRLGLSSAHVRSVATFYTMYYKKPVGKYHIQICRTLSCMLRGGRELAARVKERFGIESGEVSEDGMWSYEEVECLGSCGSGPMLEINDVYFEHLNIEKLDALLDKIEAEQPDLRYSTLRGDFGDTSGFVMSEVWKAKE